MTLAAGLALIAAFLFALAAALQQKGALNLPTISLADPKSLVRLLGEKMWLIGTLALFTGYAFQAGALDRGRLSIIQPLLVTTVVFALPLGYFLTQQHVGRREVIGAVVILVGLALFVYFGDPAGGKDNASNTQWAITIGIISGFSVLLLIFGSGGGLTMKAAVYGTVAGVLFGLSSALTKPTLDYLHQSVGTMLSHWECYALAVAGVLGFVLQQVSLGTGRLAPSVATVSVANPVVGILIGMLLLDETLSRPAWHIVLAVDRPQPGARRSGRDLARAGGRQAGGNGRGCSPTAPSRRCSGRARREQRRLPRRLLRDRRRRQSARPHGDVRRHPERAPAHERHRLPDRLPARHGPGLRRRPDRRSGRRGRAQLARHDRGSAHAGARRRAPRLRGEGAAAGRSRWWPRRAAA